MRDFVFLELRECNRTIRMMEDSEQRKAAYYILSDTVRHMCRLCNIAYKKGLLALEETVSDMSDFHNNKYLESIMLLIVDGVEPNLVEELSLARYFSMGLEGVDALQYLVMLSGTLAIQSAETCGIMEQKLLSFLPEEAVEIYQKEKERLRCVPVDGQEVDLSVLESLYEGEMVASPSDECYSQMKAADDAIKALDDKSMQRFLRDVTNSDLIVALKGLSGEARRRVFMNMSEQLAVLLAEDMEFMGDVQLEESAEAITKIMSILNQLIHDGEIC